MNFVYIYPIILYILFTITIIKTKIKNDILYKFITIIVLLYYLLNFDNKEYIYIFKYPIILLIFIIFIFIQQKIKTIENISIENIENNETIIPLDIYQTWNKKDLPPKMKECIENLKKDNPEFTHHLYDDEDCRNFIKNNYDEEVLNAFDNLIPGAYKADLWRYCILYKYGGIYLDIKYQCENGFKLIELTDKEYFVLDRPQLREINNDEDVKYISNPDYLNNFENYIDKSVWNEDNFGVYNALMVCKKNNPILLNCINGIVENVKNKYYGKSPLSPTGPILLGKYYFVNNSNNYNSFELCYSINGKFILNYKKKIIILSHYPEYRDEVKQYTNKEYYNTLWVNKKIYNI